MPSHYFEKLRYFGQLCNFYRHFWKLSSSHFFGKQFHSSYFFWLFGRDVFFIFGNWVPLYFYHFRELDICFHFREHISAMFANLVVSCLYHFREPIFDILLSFWGTKRHCVSLYFRNFTTCSSHFRELSFKTVLQYQGT